MKILIMIIALTLISCVKTNNNTNNTEETITINSISKALEKLKF